MNLEHVDVVDFLQALGIRNIDHQGDEVQYSCPFPVHGYGDSTPSAYMNADTTAYYCHSCKAKGNAVHFLAKLEGISPLLAVRHIRERYGDGFRETDGDLVGELEQILADDPPVPIRNEKIEYSLEALVGDPLEYMRGRGFKDDTLEAWQIGYDKFSNRIAIPVRNENGVLIGFKARAYLPDHQPKYLILGDREGRPARYGFPTYDVSKVVFGLDRVNPHIDSLIIVEGELNVLALSSYGYSNAVACGSNFSSVQRDLILAYSSSVTLFMDYDAAGMAASARIADELGPYVQVKDVGPHSGDPASLPSDECGRLISGATSELEKQIAPRNEEQWVE